MRAAGWAGFELGLPGKRRLGPARAGVSHPTTPARGGSPDGACGCETGQTVVVPDPVSWLLIRPGWKLLSADGREVGEVDEVAGDDTEDIFDGLAIATNALGKPRYVPAEQVAEITEGIVHLSLTREQVEELGEYLEPATTAEIEPDSKRGTGAELGAEVRKIEGEAFAPIQRHEHSMNLWRRIAFFFRRLVS